MKGTVSSVDKRLESLRTQLSAALGDDFGELAAETLREAVKSTKRVRVQRACMKCGCSHHDYVDVQDSITAVAAVKLAVEQLEGRPGVAGEAEDGRLVVQRVYVREQIQASVPGWVDLVDRAVAGDAGALEALAGELRASMRVETVS